MQETKAGGVAHYCTVTLLNKHTQMQHTHRHTEPHCSVSQGTPSHVLPDRAWFLLTQRLHTYADTQPCIVRSTGLARHIYSSSASRSILHSHDHSDYKEERVSQRQQREREHWGTKEAEDKREREEERAPSYASHWNWVMHTLCSVKSSFFSLCGCRCIHELGAYMFAQL